MFTLPARVRAEEAEQHKHERNEQSWKRFGYNTEAGKLLYKLYSGERPNNTVRYPKLKLRKDRFSVDGAERWRSGTAFLPRQSNRRHVKVPKVRHREEDVPEIELMPKRKSRSKIEQELRQRRDEAVSFRPAPTRVISTEVEKRRLALSNQFKGGKVLPTEGTAAPIATNVPLHLVTQRLTSGAMRGIESAKLAKYEKQQSEQSQQREHLETQFEQLAERVTTIKGKIEESQFKPSASRILGGLRQQMTDCIFEMKRIDDILQEA